MNQNINHVLDKFGATPGKLTLVAVLFAVLVVSAMVNFGMVGDRVEHTDDEKLATAAVVEHKINKPASDVLTRAVAVTRATLEVDWPEISIADASSYDPFAKPEFLKPSPQPVLEPPAEPATLLRQAAASCPQRSGARCDPSTEQPHRAQDHARSESVCR